MKQKGINPIEKTNSMKKLTPNYATLHLGIDDLELINQALSRLLIYTKNEEKKSELSRLIWQFSQAINPELYQGSDSNLINS